MGLAMFLPSMSGADPCTLFPPISQQLLSYERRRGMAYGSPMIKLSPALIDGTRPSEPTRAAAPSLGFLNCQMHFQRIWN